MHRCPSGRPILAQSSVSSKTIGPSPASSLSRFSHDHALASEEKPASMAEIVRRENSAAGTPSIKSYSSLTFCAQEDRAVARP
jgi:hypothetical protein